MEITRKTVLLAAVVFLPLFLAGCLNVRVVRNVSDPGEYFDRALGRIGEIQSACPNREGNPQSLNIIVFDGGSRELVQVKTPLWIVRAALDAGEHSAGHEDDRRWGKRYDFDWNGLSDLGRFGRGLLVQVDDGRDKVLVWLD